MSNKSETSARELAERICKFRIEYRNGESEPWLAAYEGQRIGASWKTDFDRVTGRFVRLHILECADPGPTLWEFQLRDRPQAWETVGTWQGGREFTQDLSRAVIEAAHYEVRFEGADGVPVNVAQAVLLLEGREAAPGLLGGVHASGLRINGTQAIGEGASTALRVMLDAAPEARGSVQIRIRNWRP